MQRAVSRSGESAVRCFGLVGGLRKHESFLKFANCSVPFAIRRERCEGVRVGGVASTASPSQVAVKLVG